MSDGPWTKYQKQAGVKPWEKYAALKPAEGPPASATPRYDFTKQPAVDAAMKRAQQGTFADVGKFADDTVRSFANGVSLGFGDKISARVDAALGQGDYASNLAANRSQSDAARSNTGILGTAAEIAGSMVPASKAAKIGVTAARIPMGIGKYLGMGIDGAGMGALSATGNDQDIATGAAYGAAGGAAGQAIGAGAGWFAKKLAQFRYTPEQLASLKINEAIDTMPGNPAEVQSKIKALGPDAMLIDALGERGGSLGRYAANISPDARELLQGTLQARRSLQNQRMVSDLESVSGLPAGNTMTVDALKKQAYDAATPAINSAYAKFRQEGKDISLDAFKDILETPMGKKAFGTGLESAVNRNFAVPGDAQSSGAMLDAVKRSLDDMASSAYRAGQNNQGSEAQALSKALRERMDEVLNTPSYANARKLRQDAYRTEDAFDLGQTLANGRVPLDAAQKVAAVAPENIPALQKSYAAQMSERLLNRNNTQGALAALETPAGQDVARSIYGDKANDLLNALSREKTFNKSLNAVSGNSTTARQLMEALGGGALGLGTAYSTGQDLMTGGLTGLALGATRRGGKALLEKFASNRSRAMAPELAKLLSQKVVPNAPAKTAAQKAIEANKELLARLLMGGAIGASQ